MTAKAECKQASNLRVYNCAEFSKRAARLNEPSQSNRLFFRTKATNDPDDPFRPPGTSLNTPNSDSRRTAPSKVLPGGCHEHALHSSCSPLHKVDLCIPAGRTVIPTEG